MPDETYQNLYPRIRGNHFARRTYRSLFDRYTGAGYVDMPPGDAVPTPPHSLLEEPIWPFHSRGGDYHEVYEWRVFAYPQPGTEFLFLDCVTSVSHIISAELIDISFDVKNLTTLRAEVIPDTTTIENNSSLEQLTEVTLSASTEKSFGLSYTTTASSTFHVGVSAGISIMGMLQIGFDAGYDYTTLATEGKISIEKHVETSTKKQVVHEPPFTRTTVDYVSTPIEGRNISFNATNKINVFDADWPIANATRALKRIGFQDMEHIQVVNNSLILSYQGLMSVMSGYNTRITVNQEPVLD